MNKKLIGGIVSGVLVGGALILGVMSLTKIPHHGQIYPLI